MPPHRAFSFRVAGKLTLRPGLLKDPFSSSEQQPPISKAGCRWFLPARPGDAAKCPTLTIAARLEDRFRILLPPAL